ncbi:MAG: hypothetical protein [Bacteriophage sp.]|nr:MAG: hypothetical protein [Bacteriophage sp.]
MYVNYGDRNFFEYGVLVDGEHSDTVFSILYCMPYCDEEDKYLFADCIVDVDDNWIGREEVMSFIGMTEEHFDPVQFAIGCIEYYGTENFTDCLSRGKYNRKEIEHRLMYYSIASDNLDTTWKEE